MIEQKFKNELSSFQMDIDLGFQFSGELVIVFIVLTLILKKHDLSFNFVRKFENLHRLT